MELLDERWTLLVVRELISGSQRFNELRRGVPRISPTLLSKRLAELVRAGVVERRGSGSDVRYVLTESGRELRPIVEALGVWGTRWIGELGDADVDPKLLLWDMHRRVNHDAVPPGQTVVALHFPDMPPKLRNWWLLITPEDADVCDSDPGRPVSVLVTASLRSLTRGWRGDTSWSQAIRAEDIRVDGPSALRRSLPEWFQLPEFAAVPRP
jgi:DNA-binding HxlR family transcriptional regulator